MRLILSSYCFKNIASVLKGGGAPDIFKKLMAEKLESYGLGCQEAIAYAKERYKYYSCEARVRLRKNGLRWLESSKEEMKKLIRSLKSSQNKQSKRTAISRFIKNMEMEITQGRFFGNTSLNYSDEVSATMINWLKEKLPKFNPKGKLVFEENEEIKKLSKRIDKIMTLKINFLKS